jgi:hypothetical protein
LARLLCLCWRARQPYSCTYSTDIHRAGSCTSNWSPKALQVESIQGPVRLSWRLACCSWCHSGRRAVQLREVGAPKERSLLCRHGKDSWNLFGYVLFTEPSGWNQLWKPLAWICVLYRHWLLDTELEGLLTQKHEGSRRTTNFQSSII